MDGIAPLRVRRRQDAVHDHLLQALRGRMRRVAQQRKESVERGREVGAAGSRVGERGLEVLEPVRQIAAVDREACGELGEGVG